VILCSFVLRLALSVANRTVGQLKLATNVVLLLQNEPLGDLIRRWLPRRIKYFGLGAQKLLWVAVTIQTPTHVQRLRLVDNRHGGEIAVARRATYTLGYVDAVIEINKLGYVMNLVPLHGDIFGIAATDEFELGALGQHLRVTTHTGLDGRDVG